MQVERTDVGDRRSEIRNMIKTYTDLEVYTRAQKLYPKVVEFARAFPKDARRLQDQLCRSANSVHANIAEGYGRSSAEFKMYLTRSLGSCNETRSHITDAVNANFCDKTTAEFLLREYEAESKQLFRLRERWK